MIKHLKPQSKINVFFNCLGRPLKNAMIIALCTALTQAIVITLSSHWHTTNKWHFYAWIIWFGILLIIHINKFIKVTYNVNLIVFLLDKIIKNL